MNLQPSDVGTEDPAVQEVERIFDAHRHMSLNFIARAVAAWHINRMSDAMERKRRRLAGVDETQRRRDAWQNLRELTARADRGDGPRISPEWNALENKPHLVPACCLPKDKLADYPEHQL